MPVPVRLLARRYRLAARAIIAIFAAAGVALSAPAIAASDSTFPSKPITIIVPIAAGGATDTVARAYARVLQPLLHVSIIVQNRPGANGTIGAQVASQAPADGYTLFVGTIGTHSVNPFLYKTLTYDPVKDFVPVSLMSEVSNVVVVPASSPAHSLAEFVALAKASPGKYDYGIGTIGSSSQLAVELFRIDAGIDIVGIPYNGPAAASLDLLANRVQIMFDPVVNQLGYIRTGKVRALAQTADHRVSALPDVPTVAEAGIPGFEASGWNGLFAPAGTPQAVVEKVSAALQEAAKSPALQDQFKGQGVEIVASSPSNFAGYLVKDKAKWHDVIDKAGIKLQ